MKEVAQHVKRSKPTLIPYKTSVLILYCCWTKPSSDYYFRAIVIVSIEISTQRVIIHYYHNRSAKNIFLSSSRSANLVRYLQSHANSQTSSKMCHHQTVLQLQLFYGKFLDKPFHRVKAGRRCLGHEEHEESLAALCSSCRNLIRKAGKRARGRFA